MKKNFSCNLFSAKHGPAARSNALSSELAAAQLQRQFFTAFPQIDANALNDIEIEAQYLAANVDGITENLGNLLHSVSNPRVFSSIQSSMNLHFIYVF